MSAISCLLRLIDFLRRPLAGVACRLLVYACAGTASVDYRLGSAPFTFTTHLGTGLCELLQHTIGRKGQYAYRTHDFRGICAGQRVLLSAPMKATLLTAATITAAIGCAAPATAFPPYPSPFMEHDGTYVVGKDVRPGLYLTLGATGGGTCSWLRLSSVGSRDVSDHIDRGESSDAQYVQIAPTDTAFETHGCQTWSMGSRPATPIAPPGPTCIYPLTGCVDPSADLPRP
jgi:hypothetical protein